MARTIVPFGPQHPVLPEPLQLQLVLEDETVVQALPAIGYVHRGLEKLSEKKDFNQMVHVVERVCGICSFQHAMSLCTAVEDIFGLEVPDRGKLLRVVWGETHRVHSHLLWLGLWADALGFESLFMQCWRIREMVMDIMEMTAGNRVIVSTNVIGGVRRDISNETLDDLLKIMDKVEADTEALRAAFLDDYAMKVRSCGVGYLTKEQAYKLGCVGPMIRASGWAIDMGMTGKYAGYSMLDFEPIVETDGDCWARTAVRFRETLQAIDLIRQAVAKIKKLEDNAILEKPKGFPKGEAVARIEQPRGECTYYVKANGTKYLERVRIRTSTFANIPSLLAMLPGCQMADVPALALTIDPCISCTER